MTQQSQWTASPQTIRSPLALISHYGGKDCGTSVSLVNTSSGVSHWLPFLALDLVNKRTLRRKLVAIANRCWSWAGCSCHNYCRNVGLIMLPWSRISSAYDTRTSTHRPPSRKAKYWTQRRWCRALLIYLPHRRHATPCLWAEEETWNPRSSLIPQLGKPQRYRDTESFIYFDRII